VLSNECLRLPGGFSLIAQHSLLVAHCFLSCIPRGAPDNPRRRNGSPRSQEGIEMAFKPRRRRKIGSKKRRMRKMMRHKK
jgi:hypothetical protein